MMSTLTLLMLPLLTTTIEKRLRPPKTKELVGSLNYSKTPRCQVVCLSYPDGTYNPTGITLFKSGLADEIPSGLDIEAVITGERSLYATALDLLRMSENPSDPDFLRVGEGKQLLIALWMQDWELSFTSGWVTFLRDKLPGGEVSERDIEIADKTFQESAQIVSEAKKSIANILTNGYPEVSTIDGEVVYEIASQYFDSAICLINELIADSMSPGEFNNRLSKMEIDFVISPVVHWECFSICAAWCGYEFGEAA